jgi:hypothetical protein
MGQNIESLAQTVKTHEDTLYRYNGVKGVVALDVFLRLLKIM